MVPASTSVSVLERAPQNGCRPCLGLQFPPASLEHFPVSAGGSATGSFQMTTSALSPRVCEILCAPFKSGVSISHSPLAPPKVIPAGL